MSSKKTNAVCGLLLGAMAMTGSWAKAQYGSTTTIAPPYSTPVPSLTPGGTAPATTSAPGMVAAPGVTSVPPTNFDPYSTQPGASLSAPSLLSPPTTSPYGTAAPTYSQPYPYGQPQAAYPQGSQPFGYQQPPPGYGTQSPPVLFPQGIYGTTPPAAPVAYGNPLKVFQNVSLNYTWLEGDGGSDLDINDIYATTTLAFPNFLWSGQPWYMSPGFGLHLWSGPSDVASTVPALPTSGQPGTLLFPFLPSKAYSAFLDLGWQSSADQMFGVELSGRLGVFTDFDDIESQSFRPQGVALMRLNLSPSLALRAGVEYINRADIKLLPAGGVLWTPSPQTRFDIYFPQPKLATYLTTIGNSEMWWYVAGEYGGGSWTVTLSGREVPDDPLIAPTDFSERSLIDINDYRVLLGVDFYDPGSGGVGKRKMFLEAGYVFNREVILVASPENSFSVGETFLLRGGLAF